MCLDNDMFPHRERQILQECCGTGVGFSQPLKNQKGAVLVIALMLLAVLTILGVAALNTTTSEIRIAGNDRVHKNAFYNAETGVAYSVERGLMMFPPGPPNIPTVLPTPVDLAAASPGTTLRYTDRGGSPRRVEVEVTSNVPGGGSSMIVAGIVAVANEHQGGRGIGTQDQYAR